MSSKDPYKLLGVATGASGDDIRKAYRRLARKYHPDANPHDPAAEEHFKEIQQAYAILSNPKRRREYDDGRSRASSWRPSGPSRTAAERGRSGWSATRSVNLSDLLGKLANLSGARDGESKEASGQLRIEDLARIAKLLGIDRDRISKLSDAGIQVKVSFGDVRRDNPNTGVNTPKEKPPKPRRPPKPPRFGKPRGA